MDTVKEERQTQGCSKKRTGIKTSTGKRKQAGQRKKTTNTAESAIEVRERAVQKVLAEVDDIVQLLIEHAMKGNYLPAKFLFEFAGVLKRKEIPVAHNEAEASSLSELLLKRLGITSAGTEDMHLSEQTVESQNESE